MGGIAGTLAMSLLVDRIRAEGLLVICYLLGAGCLGLIARVDVSSGEMLVVVALAGVGIVGGQIAANAVSAHFYPTPIRSTGVGWAIGIGRFGSIAGAVIGGILLGWNTKATVVFEWSVAPTLVGALASLALLVTARRLRARAAQPGVIAPE